MRTAGLDANALRGLQASAGRDPKAAIQEAAKQFESLFMQQLLKSMRDSTMASGMLDNSGTKMGTELLDTQLAGKLSGQPGGLAAMIAKQLERQIGAVKDTAAPAAPARSAAAAKDSWNRLPGASDAQDFVARHSAAAEKVAAETGIPAAFILSQAAHESGWGKKQIRNADGSTSHNLFGIKAGGRWNGATAEVTTTEYVGGQPQKVKASFRAYASAEESFRDWARLIKDSPRYAKVVEEGGSAQGFAVNLQRAGYATDPQYAAKLGRVINTTLRLQKTLQT
ncbi:MAG TPA: flagellar assembly peptidoglycan hydrolase FlgJ [Methylibium sp.]|uniref:flagellar assembly peptidoglycan hydrolase FlgJ n=1 Tax=Methylibium sp. TaxID=2067992 RepID=UPI002DB94131|nr:flagellar assembly peptidoglycan hydrolase FlgJ [Methylibium sp.]HEU4457992.1 flagellar assembly peptidoglycan hydrolase FlgJ [Methylibium sp.]